MICIHIYEGDQFSETKQFDIHSVFMGRSKDNTLCFDSQSVSGKHAALFLREKGLYVIDFKSTNGTLLNGEKILPSKELLIENDSIISIGKFHLKVSFDSIEEKDSHFDLHKEHVQKNNDHIANNTKMTEAQQFKNQLQERLYDEIDLRRLDINRVNDDELRSECLSIINSFIHDMKKNSSTEIDWEEIIQDVLDEAVGLGPLEVLMKDDTISEIMVIRKDQIYVEKNGQLFHSLKNFSSDDSLLGVIQRIVSPIGRRVDESSPMVDARLKDGSRVNVVIPPLAIDGPCITIRKFPRNTMTINDLTQSQTLTDHMQSFLEVCVVNRKNIIISGGTGSGKTTTLNILGNFIPNTERIITIEDTAELKLNEIHNHIVRMESRPPNIEGNGEITIRQLVRNALRMRCDRIICGEMRGPEAFDCLQAMNTGHDGSLATAHANSPQDLISRIENMVMMAGENLPSNAIREQIASAVQIVIQQTRFKCGSRKITHISEVIGIQGGVPILQDIFYFKPEGFDENNKIKGSFMATGWIPNFYKEIQKAGVSVDMSIFHN